MNYFSLFAIDEHYILNLPILEQRYRTLQREKTPNQFLASNESEHLTHLQTKEQVKDGFHVLKDDIQRGLHLLEVRGIPLPSEQEAIDDAEFLTEQMDLREALASAQSIADIIALDRTIKDKISDYIDNISMLLSNNESKKNYLAGIELNKLKFIKKLESEIQTRKTAIEKS